MNPDLKRKLIPWIPYVFIGLLGTKLSQGFRLAPGTDAGDKLIHFTVGLNAAMETAFPSFHPMDLLFGILMAALIRLAVQVKGQNAKKFRKNMEYGSARWGSPEDIAPYKDKDFKNNIILTQTEFLTMNSRPAQPKYARNKNVLVIGGSGSGKTRYFIKPNLMQCTSKTYPVSFIVTDPKASLARREISSLRCSSWASFKVITDPP